MNLTQNISDASTLMFTTAYNSPLYTTVVKTTARSPNDTSILQQIEKELEGLGPLEVFTPLAICSLVIFWCIFSLLYSSRVLGFVITQVLGKLYKGGHLKIGSFSVSVLGGKLMFRDIQYITEDASVRIRYAWAIFRWWGPYKAKDVSMNLSNEPIRLEFYVEGIEFHVYNRSSEYARLEKIFGLDELMMPSQSSGSGNSPSGKSSRKSNARQRRERLPAVASDSSMRGAARQTPKNNKTKKISINWRSLVPVIKVDIVDGQALFGNALTPQTLMIKFAEAKGTYSTKKASNLTDLFTHVVNGNVELLRVLLVPSTGYTGPQELPPRNMGEGFVVAHTHRAEVYFYMDEPGTVPYEPEVMQMANGECVVKQTFPEWGMEIKCSKTSPKKTALCMTNISYGPWADRHRAALYKFFFPADHQTHPIMDSPEPGERRVHRQFDFRLTFLVDTMIDILYTKDKEMHALHMQAGPGSSLAFVLPLYVDNPRGYVTTIRGQLLHAESTTSLSYRDLLRAEMLDFDLQLHYPRFWNDHQDWQIKLTAHKASVFFLYEHVDFFFDMISDWNSPREVPDIFSFVPYTVFLEVQLKDFEFIFVTNEHNWVNTTSSGSDENAHLAICGDLLSLPVTMPFHEFLPEVVMYRIDVSGECIDARLFLPESNTSRQLLLNLAHNARIVDRNGMPLDQPFGTRGNKWRKVTEPSEGWVDVMSTPMVGVKVRFASHPRHTLNEEAYDDLMTSVYGSHRVDSPTVSTASHFSRPPLRHSDSVPADFDRTLLPPDEVTVDVEVAQSVIMLYGSLLKYFLHLKENYLGENLKMADMCNDRAQPHENHAFTTPNPPVLTAHSTVECADKKNCRMPAQQSFDPRAYRSYAVKVSVILQDIQGHLVQHCTPTAPPCPTAYVQGLVFEMDKRYEEMKLQVVVSPVTVLSWDHYQRADGGGGGSHLQHGHLSLSGLQVRGHGMFSHYGLPLESDTIEYAWLMELTLGDIKGKITAPQLHSVVQFLRTAAFLVDDVENQLCRPSAERCQHQNPQPSCSLSQQALEEHRKRAVAAGEEPPAWNVVDESICPTEGEIKYRMTRCSVDLIDVYIAESGVALNVQVYPIRFATCNLHGANNKAGLTALVQCVHLKQYVCTSSPTASSDRGCCKAATAAAAGTATGHPDAPAADVSPLPASGGGGGVGGGLPATSSPTATAATDRKLLWLEAGALVLGPVNVDAAMSLPAPELRALQHDFLQRHDRRRRNLWFLWPSVERQPPPPAAATGGGAKRRTDGSECGGGSSRSRRAPPPIDRCACHGGCVFFGRNENGRSFFHAVQPSDFSGEARSMLAVPRLTQPPHDPGFGQSILQPLAFVLDMPDVHLAGWSANGTGLPTAASGSRVRGSARTTSRGVSQPGRRAPRQTGFADATTEAYGTAASGAAAAPAAAPDSWDHPSPSSTLKPTPFMRQQQLQSSNDQHASDCASAMSPAKRVAVVGRGTTSTAEAGGDDDDDDDESEAVTVVGRTDGSGRCSRSTSAGQPSPARVAAIAAGSRASPSLRQQSVAATPTTAAHASSLAGSTARPWTDTPASISREGFAAHLMPGSLGSSDSFYSAESSFSVSSSQPKPERRQRPRTRPPRWTRQISTNSDGTRARVASPASEIAAAAGLSGSSTQSLYEMAQPYLVPAGDEYGDLARLHDVRPEWYSSSSSDVDLEDDVPPRLIFDDDEHLDSDGYYDEDDDYQLEYNVNRNADSWPADPYPGQTVPPEGDQLSPLSESADLQGQLKNKITNSVLLMSCYMRHMSRLRSQSWSVLPQPPHLRLSARSPLADKPVANTFGVSGLCSPRFTTIAKGFSPEAMTVKKSTVWQRHSTDSSSTSSESLDENTTESAFHQANQEIYQDATAGVETKEEKTEGYSKTTAICRVVGSIDILVSPLSVEAFQRYLDALMPVFAQEHPAAIVDNLHFEVSSNVQSQNKIKKMQAKLETQDRTLDGSAKPRDDSPASRFRADAKEGAAKQPHASSKAAGVAVLPTQPSRQRSSTLPIAFQGRSGTEPQRDWRLQIMVAIAKVNVCVLQASVTEDLTPMLSGEHVRDLTSVSLLAVCLYDISFTNLLHSHSRRLCSAAAASEVTAGRSESIFRQQPTAVQTSETSPSAPTDSFAITSSSTSAPPALQRRNSSTVNIGIGGGGSQPTVTYVTASAPDAAGSRDDEVFEEARDAVHADARHTQTARPKTTPETAGRTHLPSASGAAAADADDSEGFEQNTEEIVGNLSVKQVHFQFRRLVDADLPNNVKLTAIPEKRSRVIFTVQQQHSPSSPRDDIGRQKSAGQKTAARKTSSFIMFECGIDHLSANAARRRGFSANQQQLPPSGPQNEEQPLRVAAAARGSDPAATKYFVEHENPTRCSTSGAAASAAAAAAPDSAHVTVEASGASSNPVDGAVRKQQLEADEKLKLGESGGLAPAADHSELLSGDATAVTVDTQMVWFSFAAPTLTQSHVDFTRLDWNLLSTASPAIDAWLNPINRLSTAVTSLMSQHKNRVTGVMACIMTTALDTPGMHFIFKGDDSRRALNTRLSRVVQEDPSCQLMSVLKRYIRSANLGTVEDAVHVSCMPPLIMLQKGMLALTRQWRNQLYMPPVTKLGKVRRGEYTVHFDVLPERGEQAGVQGSGTVTGEEENPPKDEDVDSHGSESDEAEDTNEGTSLLQPPLGRSPSVVSQQSKGKFAGVNSSNPLAASAAGKRVPTGGDSTHSDSLSQSCYENPANDTVDGPAVDNLQAYLNQLEPKEKDDEDLYRWMARQQEYSRSAPLGRPAAAAGLGLIRNRSLLRSMVSEVSGDTLSQGLGTTKAAGGTSNANEAVARLADAQLMFRPLLEAVGLNIHGLKSSAIMRNTGGNLSIATKLQSFCIDIVEEGVDVYASFGIPPLNVLLPGPTGSQANEQAKVHGQRPHCFVVPPSPKDEATAFSCKLLSISVSLKDMLYNSEKAGPGSPLPTAHPADSRRSTAAGGGVANMKQQSAHAISVAIRNLEASRPTTKVYVSADLVGVSQHVNMALLRLLHQVFTVIENMNWTRAQIRKQERLETNQLSQYRKTHRKQDSSSSADTQYASAAAASGTADQPAAAAAAEPEMTDVAAVTAQVPMTHPAVVGNTCLPGASQHESTVQRTGGVQVLPGAHSIKEKSSPIPVARRPSKLQLNRHIRKFNLSVKHDPLASKSPTNPLGTAASTPVDGIDGWSSPTVGVLDVDAAERQPLLLGSPGQTGGCTSYTGVSGVDKIPGSPDSDSSDQPRPTQECWKKLSHLLDLYSKTPETKTVSRKHSVTRLSDIAEETEGEHASVRPAQPSVVAAELGQALPPPAAPGASSGQQERPLQPAGPAVVPMSTQSLPPTAAAAPAAASASAKVGPAVDRGTSARSSRASPEFTKGMFSSIISPGENVLLIAFGYLRVHDVSLHAALGGLKLEAEIRNIYGCLTHKTKEKRLAGPASGYKLSSEMSVTLNVDKSFASLLEDSVVPHMQKVVSVSLSRSYCLYTSVTKRKRDYNAAVLSLGAVNVNIPQHASSLHEMVTRSSRRLHDTFQQLTRRSSQHGGHPTSTPGLAGSSLLGSNLVSAAAAGSAVSSNVSLQAGGASNGASGAAGAAVPEKTATSSDTALGGTSSTQSSAVYTDRPAVERAPSAAASVADPLAAANSAATDRTGVDAVDSATGMLSQPITTLGPGSAVEMKRRPKKPFVVHFQVALKSLTVRASLLPSLKAQYQFGQVTWSGVSGSRPSFAVHVTSHSLSFTAEDVGRDVPLLPSSASVDLPPMRVDAEYRIVESHHKAPDVLQQAPASGSYLYAVAEVGVFEHSLTTNLLNHLIVVQKVFVKEINDVLQKVAGSELSSDAPPATEHTAAAQPSRSSAVSSSKPKLLYEIALKLKGIQVTATTPTSTAVRFETGAIEMEVSNRLHRPEDDSPYAASQRVKLFFKVHVDVNLSLGQLVKNLLFEEAEAEFHAVSFFATSIDLRNALEDELSPNNGKDNAGPRSREAVLISLRRPIFSVQPAAFDKAVMVWLSYRSAYEYWHEQRRNLAAEMQATVRGPTARARSFAFGSDSSGLSAGLGGPRSVLPSRLSSDDIVSSTLFLQLTITDLGICLPLVSPDALAEPVMSSLPCQVNPALRSASVTSPTRRLATESEPGNAVVLTIKETQINACSCGSLSSRGNFSGFCLRFAKDFEVSLDDWKPDSSEEPVMNACIVQQGTVEVCSQTVSSKSVQPSHVPGSLASPLSTVSGTAEDAPNAKWILHIGWEMEGMDVNLNTSISKHLSELGHALTALTGDTEDSSSPLTASLSSSGAAAGLSSPKASQSVDEVDAPLTTGQVDSTTRSVVDVADLYYDSDADPETRIKTLENEILRLAHYIQELRQAGAKPSDIEVEEKKLGELESLLGSQFRRGFMDRIKRQSARATTFKDSLGLSFRHSSHHRSSAVGAAAGTMSRARRINVLTPVAEHSWSVLPRSAYEEAPDDVDSSIGGVLSPRQPVSSPTATITRAVGSEGQVRIGSPMPLTEDALQPSSGPVASPLPASAIVVPAEQAVVVMRRKGRLPPLNLEPYSHDASPGSRGISVSNQLQMQPQAPTSNSASSGEAPTIDLVLEITVKIKSGHCVLHPNDMTSLQTDAEKEAAKGSRNVKNTLSHSPPATRKARGESVTSQSLGAGRSPKAPDNRTVFLLPGIEVKLHYESRNGAFGSPPSSLQRNVSPSVIHEAPPRFTQPPQQQPGSAATGQAAVGTSGRRATPKRANIYAWIELQALSEEMVVTTKLLDFLEQALEQIDLEQLRPKSGRDKDDGVDLGEATDDDIAAESASTGESSTSAIAAGTSSAVVGSFPVDIIVYCSVQPSLIRFSCLPVSRIECLVQLPSLSLVFSTQRNDLDSGDSVATAAPDSKKESRTPLPAGTSSSSSSNVAGLSVTACLADFSVFVFHPYGGSTAMSGGTTSAGATRRDATPLGMPWAESSTSESRDDGGRSSRRIWLSLNMKLLKVHLGRTRRSTVELAPPTTGDIGCTASSVAGDKLCNSVKFSMVVDMDSAEFKFDMRRLSDILDLPKAWYRSSLARRMFLGDETNLQHDLDNTASPQPHASVDLGIRGGTLENFDPAVLRRHRRTMSDGQYGILSPAAPSGRWQLQRPRGHVDTSAYATLGPTQARAQKPSQPVVSGSKSAGSTLLRMERQRLKAQSLARQKQSDKLDVGGSQPRHSWKTLVLGAVNLSKFELRVNMGNLMGSTVWNTDKLKCQGRLSVDSLGHKEVSASARLMQSDLEAKGGVTGGIIQLSSLNSFVAFRESCGELPSHKLGVGLATMETKLDYMGTSVLMLRLSDLDAQVSDDWNLTVSPNNGTRIPPSPTGMTARAAQRTGSRFGTAGESGGGVSGGAQQPSTSPVQISVCGSVEFNQLQVMITRSTTPDLIKMAARVDEYFRQQMRSSKRMFDPSTFGMRADFVNSSGSIGGGLADAASAEDVTQAINHRRHWQNVLRRAAGSLLVCQLPGCQPLPERGSLATIMGGSLRFQGKNLSLACYHGVNFRSKSWVLFILQEPSVIFAAEAQDTQSALSNAKVDTRIIQSFIFSLGQSTTRRLAPYSRVATICKVSRSQMPPTFNTVSEWFAYTFANPELKDFARFDSASLDPVGLAAAEPVTPKAKASGSGSSGISPSVPSASKKSSYRYSHDMDIIFTLPSLVLQMKTDHRQLYRKPTESDPRPEVHVSFVTEFEGHISVAMDAELIMYLHEVVTSYVRERETQKDVDGKVIEPASGSKFTTDTTGELKKDWREFLCSQWQLEPTVRLLSWPGGRIEPVGVDYILTQLGFRHARSTIPKWIQRGMMDPCDALCAKLVKGLLIAMQKKSTTSGDLDSCSDSSSASEATAGDSDEDDGGNGIEAP